MTYAQTQFVEGILRNSQNNQTIPYATVILHKSIDSTFISASATDSVGKFQLSTPSKENFYLQISHIEYNDTLIKILFDNPVGTIYLRPEPLLRYKELTHVISSLRSSFKNISFAIQSNGILIDQDVANFIKSNHITIGISIDGSNREANKNRLNANNDPKFEKIQNGINTLLSNKIDIGIISVISKENLAYLIDSFDYFVSKGIKRFSYNMFIPAGNGSGKDQDVEIDSLVAFYVKIACKINDYNLKKELNQYIGERSISSMINSLIFKTFQMCYTSPCGAGQHLIAIDTNGDVYPCDDFIESKMFTMGNIGDDTPFETMLTNQMFIKLRNRSIDTIPQCSKCSIKHLCIYKCPSNSFYYHDSLYFSHRMCRFSKKIIPAFMELLHTGRIESRYFKPF